MDEKIIKQLKLHIEIAFDREDYKEAIQPATELIEATEPNTYYNNIAYAYRGWAYANLYDYKNSFPDLIKARKGNIPDYFKEIYMPFEPILIEVLYEVGKYKQALKEQDNLIKEVPERHNFFMRAKILTKLGKFTEARKDVKRACVGTEKFHPQYRKCVENDIKELLKEIEEGEKEFRSKNAKK